MKLRHFFPLLMALSCRGLFAESLIGIDKLPENLVNLLEISLRAPSSHNTQMWKIRLVSENEIAVCLDRERLLAEVDPDAREAMIGIGALVWNIIAAAPEFGYEAKMSYPDNSGETVRILFESLGRPETGNAVELIKKRATIRTPYLRKNLDQADIDCLLDSSGNIRMHYFQLESAEGNYIANSTLEAADRQTQDNFRQSELSQWLRFSKKERDDKMDGITPEMMGFRGMARDLIYLAFNEKTAMKKSFRNQTGKTFRKQLDNCAGFVIITSENSSVSSLVGTGIALEKLWLKAAERNIAIHPMSQLLEEEPWMNEAAGQLGINGKLQLVLRAGYVDGYPAPVSRRRSLEDVVMKQLY